jgi:glycerol uptake facilitator-like aquaporin
MKKNFPFLVKIWFAQIIGAVVGVLISFLMQFKDGETISPGIAILCPSIANDYQS